MPVTNGLVFDVETSVIRDIEAFSHEPVRVPARYKDPDKIRDYIEEARRKQAEFAALDIDLARVVCVAWTGDGKHLAGDVAQDEDAEREVLKKFWSATLGMRLVGFNILDFDLPLLIRRSQYLDVSYPDIDLGRYARGGPIDIMQFLTWQGKVNARSLNFYCRRFGIKAPDDAITGADVPTCVMAGDWQKVKQHCAIDVLKEWRLAEKLGLVESPKGVDKDSPF
jgi:hypothetical protein